MRVSGLVITHQLSEEGSVWLADLARVVDEVVAVVAEERAQPGLIARLEALGARVFRPRWKGFYPADDESRAMIAACQGDWILKLDHDEELSPEWHDPAWREIVRDNARTHFWVQRRWVTAPGKFLGCEPWSPDWQLRLFRNQPEQMTFAAQLHESMTITGAAGYLRTLSIHHHDLWLCPRSAREEKARIYEELRPGHSLGYFYLHEDWEIEATALPRESAFQLETEVMRMEAIAPATAKLISLKSSAPPRFLGLRGHVWIDVAVVNGTEETLCHGAPFPMRLAYHWLHLPSRKMAVFEGLRTSLVPELGPRQTRSWSMFVVAPPLPGHYLLQVTLVQENARWLEEFNPDLVQEFEITVLEPTANEISRPQGRAA